MADKTIYRIFFEQEDVAYEIYARSVTESDMFGFLVIEDFLFGEMSTLVIDPKQEKLKAEFSGVKRTYVPMHYVVRIDEVEREGTAKIHDLSSRGGRVSPFPPLRSGDKKK